MKKKFLTLLAILLIKTAVYAQLDVPDAGSISPLSGGSWLRFPTGGNATSIVETWGLNLMGSPTQPVKVLNTSLLVGYTSGGGNVGANNLFVNGNVGIGLLATQAKLHISDAGTSANSINAYSGNVIIQGNSGGRSFTSGASMEFVIPANTDGSNPWGQARIIAVAGNNSNGDATGKLILGTRRWFDKGTGTGAIWNYGDDLVIDGAGNIGVGTTSPNGYKLAVKGSLHAQAVQVDMAGWSDYVFEPNYKLASLTDVNTYINKNHHLPDIPSAEQVKTEGIDLGEINAKLLKKLEEMTLYLIEEHKNNQDQKEQIGNQRQEIVTLKKQVRSLLKHGKK